MTLKDLSLVLTLFLGITFLLSSLVKLRDRRDFIIGVLTYEILPRRDHIWADAPVG